MLYQHKWWSQTVRPRFFLFPVQLCPGSMLPPWSQDGCSGFPGSMLPGSSPAETGSLFQENSDKKALVYPWTKICGQESKNWVKLLKDPPLKRGGSFPFVVTQESRVVTKNLKSAWVWVESVQQNSSISPSDFFYI